ncbi:hypothetical protein ABVK25_012391 [Lepraria finkii]|uniref:Secreted protein n=1 Tax=Lepraria finkii TaxID=1340010 RepID=A0ABR4AHH1_9LECA
MQKLVSRPWAMAPLTLLWSQGVVGSLLGLGVRPGHHLVCLLSPLASMRTPSAFALTPLAAHGTLPLHIPASPAGITHEGVEPAGLHEMA